MKYVKLLAAAGAVVGLMMAGVAVAQPKPKLAFVVNGPSDFWKLAEAGVRKAQRELPTHELLFKYPERGDAAIQQRLLEDLMASGVAAVAVSVLDPKTQIDMLNKIGSAVPLLTFDSDAPSSKRLAYIGSSNTDLGRNAGEIAAKAMPKGGKCMGFVGNTGSDNARERIEGFKAVAGKHNIQMVDVRTDDHDQTRARANVDDVLVARPEINCMVGFYSYNPPRIYEALRDSGKLGKITVIAFDEDPITLGAVKEGAFAGTVVQQPYEWGYQGMKLLADVLKGDKRKIPSNGLLIIPGIVVNKGNVDQFRADLQAKLKS
jgi:ribose transport system substrate-binding protein